MNPENQIPNTAIEPLIEMRNVVCASMRDRHLTVAREVNWTVRPGDYWVIAGLQGTGKTDFLLMTAGLMPPRSGDYRFLGEPMPIFDESRLAHRLRVGLVFDGGQLLNHLTVRENIALPLRYHQNLDDAAAAPKVQEFLRAFELEPFANSTPGAIGRSWQKRVGLARGLILNPDLLLVDNPLGALDLKHACWWLQFLDQLSRGQALNGGKRVTLVLAVSELRPWRARARQFGFLQEQRFFTADSWSEASTIHAERVRDLLEDQQDYLTPGPQT